MTLTPATLAAWNEAKQNYENSEVLSKSARLYDLYVSAKLAASEGFDFSAIVARITELPISVVRLRIENIRVDLSWDDISEIRSTAYRPDGSPTLETLYQRTRWRREVRSAR